MIHIEVLLDHEEKQNNEISIDGSGNSKCFLERDITEEVVCSKSSLQNEYLSKAHDEESTNYSPMSNEQEHFEYEKRSNSLLKNLINKKDKQSTSKTKYIDGETVQVKYDSLTSTQEQGLKKGHLVPKHFTHKKSTISKKNFAGLIKPKANNQPQEQQRQIKFIDNFESRVQLKRENNLHISNAKDTNSHPIYCEYCKCSFENKQSYFQHRKAEESPHYCTLCGKCEPFKGYLIAHMLRYHADDTQTEPAVNDVGGQAGRNIFGIVKKNTNSEILDSVECSNSTEREDLVKDRKKETNSLLTIDCITESYNSKEQSKLVSDFNLNQIGISRKEKIRCSLCAGTFSSADSLKVHLMTHTGETAYKCCVCTAHFTCLSSRQHHMSTHLREFRYNCIPCSKGFATRADLASHQMTHKQQCPLCGDSFPNKTTMNCHFRVIHNQEMLKCNECSKTFASEPELTRHKLYHRNYKREKCPECGAFVTKLKDHMTIHDKTNRGKVFACDQCPAQYLRLSNLKRHKLSHSGIKPYRCCHCEKKFSTNALLNKHLLIHTKEKPHQCEICGVSFAHRFNMVSHKLIHSNTERFSCSECGLEFNHKSSMKKHIKAKHNNSLSSVSSNELEKKTDNAENYTSAVYDSHLQSSTLQQTSNNLI